MNLLKQKWCCHCAKPTHDSDECWSTHSIPPQPTPLHELLGRAPPTIPPFPRAAIGTWLDGSSVNPVAVRAESCR